MMNIVVMGLGKISRRVAEGVKQANGANLYAACSRTKEKAQAFSNEFEADTYFDDFETMLNDEKVDLVYITTPNDCHFNQIVACLNHGKHVLCEKPMVASQEELTTIFDLAKEKNCFLMEAEKTLFTPLNHKIKEMIYNDFIGEIVSIEATYSNRFYYDSQDLSHWVFNSEFGGAMFDIGVYAICYANYFSNSTIQDIQTSSVYAKEGFDLFTKGLLTYENGVIGDIACGWISPNENVGIIYGTKGYFKTKEFWKNCETTLVIDGKEEIIKIDPCSDFKGEIEHAIACIENGLNESPVLGHKQSSQILEVVLSTKKDPIRLL